MAAERPPSVDRLVREVDGLGLPQPLVVDAVRAALAGGGPELVEGHVEAAARRLMLPVINATGVLLHTNLGRAPLAVGRDASYTNLEFDLATGKRSSRHETVGAVLARACGAEAALVVNNGAAGVMLALAALAQDQGVAVSRGELIEVGGGFRLPDVMALSGARLVEVGTTNRTRAADYESVLDEVAVVFKVHRSNYRITGFTEDAPVKALADLARPLVVDLGSGLLDASCPWLADGPPEWLRGEPAVRQTLTAGADLVLFSGDKLLGGPQAGVIAGKAQFVEACARHPLYRAMRPGALVLATLQDVALAYLGRDAASLPFWRMALTSQSDLLRRAHGLGHGTVVDCASITGGGTLPGVEIPSAGIALQGDVTAELRSRSPKPIIARIENDATVLDLRTVDPDDDCLLVDALAAMS